VFNVIYIVVAVGKVQNAVIVTLKWYSQTTVYAIVSSLTSPTYLSPRQVKYLLC